MRIGQAGMGIPGCLLGHGNGTVRQLPKHLRLRVGRRYAGLPPIHQDPQTDIGAFRPLDMLK